MGIILQFCLILELCLILQVLLPDGVMVSVQKQSPLSGSILCLGVGELVYLIYLVHLKYFIVLNTFKMLDTLIILAFLTYPFSACWYKRR